MKLGQIESHFERLLKLNQLLARQRSHEIMKVRFAYADEVVAHDPARMLKPFAGSDLDLRG